MRVKVVSVIYPILVLWVILSCYQIYLFRIGGSILPLTTLLMLSLIPFINFNQFRDKLYLCYTILFIWTLLTYFWSVNIGLWLYQIFFAFIFLISYSVFKRLNDLNKLFPLLKLFLISCSINAVLVILFRLYPVLEAFFIQNFLGFFKNPDRLTTDVLLNVWDINKSGGVFDNGNTAATLHLVCFGFTIMLKKYLKFYLYYFFILINALAVLASGSKSALIILFGSVFFSQMLYFYYYGNVKQRIIIFLILSFFLLCAYFLTSSILDYFFSSDFGQKTADTSQDRYNLYTLAYDLFVQHPFQGLGFGGWQENIERLGVFYSVLNNWPPHNSLIEAWATTGLIGFAFSFLIIVLLFLRSISFLKLIDLQQGKGLIIALLGAILMPLGDPQPLLGPVQVAPALGIACAYCYLRLKRS